MIQTLYRILMGDMVVDILLTVLITLMAHMEVRIQASLQITLMVKGWEFMALSLVNIIFWGSNRMKRCTIFFAVILSIPALAFGFEPDGQPHYFNTSGSIDYTVDQWYLQLNSKMQAVTCHITVLNDIQPYKNNTVKVSLNTASYRGASGADRDGARIISQQGYVYFYQNKPVYERGKYYSYFHFDFSPTPENPNPQIKISCKRP